MSSSITMLDFARICEAAYNTKRKSLSNGFVQIGFTKIGSGFHGATYCRKNHSNLDVIVAYTGTETEGSKLDFVTDVVADFGFLGGFGPGFFNLQIQLNNARSLLQTTQLSIKPTDRLYLTGHSLGGGLAQVIAAYTGLPAVVISSPAVSHLMILDFEGRAKVSSPRSDLECSKASIFCLKVDKDFINRTHVFGHLLGQVITVYSSRTGFAAHSIAETVLELSPSGSQTDLGRFKPFS